MMILIKNTIQTYILYILYIIPHFLLFASKSPEANLLYKKKKNNNYFLIIFKYYGK